MMLRLYMVTWTGAMRDRLKRLKLSWACGYKLNQKCRTICKQNLQIDNEERNTRVLNIYTACQTRFKLNLKHISSISVNHAAPRQHVRQISIANDQRSSIMSSTNYTLHQKTRKNNRFSTDQDLGSRQTFCAYSISLWDVFFESDSTSAMNIFTLYGIEGCESVVEVHLLHIL